MAPGFEEAEALLGRYRPIRELAKGGFATILLAADLQSGSADDLVVIKRLQPDHQQPEKASSRLRFRTEGELLTDFADVPGIVRLFDNVEAGTDRMLVLEYIDGISLSQCIERFHHLPPDKACRVTLSLLVILSKVHRRGVLHRDIKPANIMITELGESPGDRTRLCLLDFGIAKRLHGDSRSTVAITQQGMLLGTMCYMAPEQRIGRSADARSDIYSVGATLYHMLAGAPPLVGSPMEIARLPQDAPIPPVPEERLVPDEIERVLFRALHPEPDARYQTADEMLHDLARATAEPVPSLIGAAPEAHDRLEPRVSMPPADAGDDRPRVTAADPSGEPVQDPSPATEVTLAPQLRFLAGDAPPAPTPPSAEAADEPPAVAVTAPAPVLLREGHVLRIALWSAAAFAAAALAATLTRPPPDRAFTVIRSTSEAPALELGPAPSPSRVAPRQWLAPAVVGADHARPTPVRAAPVRRPNRVSERARPPRPARERRRVLPP